MKLEAKKSKAVKQDATPKQRLSLVVKSDVKAGPPLKVMPF